MTEDLKRIRIFIGSPADVAEERQIARRIVEDIARSPLLDQRFDIKPVMWDVDAYANNAARTPQQNIAEGLPRPSDCDISVFIFWSRIGTDLILEDLEDRRAVLGFVDVPMTGSTWELLDGLHGATREGSRHQVFWLRCKRPVPMPDDDKLLAHTEQQLGVAKLFGATKDASGRFVQSVTTYASIEEFSDEFRKQLSSAVKSITDQKQIPDHEKPAKARSSKPQELSRPTEYLQWLAEKCADVSLMGLEADQVRTFGILHRIYVPAVTPSRKLDVEKARRSGPRPDREPAHELLLHRIGESSLYVSGIAGSGKSTLCKWLCLCAARGEVPQSSDQLDDEFVETYPASLRDLIPIWCRLRTFCNAVDWKPGVDEWSRSELEQHLGEWLKVSTQFGDFRAWLDRGKLLLVLDGFDEVAESVGTGDSRAYPRSSLLSALQSAVPKWTAQGNHVLLTSRPYGLAANETAKLGLDEAALSPMPSALQHVFVRRWFEAIEPTQANELAEVTWQQINARPDVAFMRDNPMMLTALCVKMLQGREIPRDLYELYEGMTRFVLHNRYKSRLQEVEPVKLKLEVVAAGMHLGHYIDWKNPELREDVRHEPNTQASGPAMSQWLREYIHSKDGASARLDAEAESTCTELITRSGLLAPVANQGAEFHHLMVQDYLAAVRLGRCNASFEEFIQHFGHQPRWRKTFVFWLAWLMEKNEPEQALSQLECLLPDLTRDILQKSPEAALTLAECLELAHSRTAITAFAKPFRLACMDALEVVEDPEPRARSFEALGKLGLDDRPGVGLNKAGLPDIDWIKIPEGQVTLEDDQGTHDVAAFEIAKYPVANAQFDAFIKDGGYVNDRWWEGVPEDARPSQPRSPGWPIPNHPRETVSWYEARAFCAWLSVKTNRTVRLPEETEWQLAAGPMAYPWGDDYEVGTANCNETRRNVGPHNLGQTSAVGVYPRCKTPRGVFDTSGNVWEWCQTRHERKLGDQETRVLRGGSWFNFPVIARSAVRFRYHPYGAFFYVGFRLARTL